MPRPRNRVILSCKACSKQYEVIHARKFKSNYCSVPCANKHSQVKRKVYPKKVGVCKYCNNDIIAKNGGFNKPNRTFCSRSCKLSWINKNMPQSEARRKESGERARRTFKGVPKSKLTRYRMSLANKGDKSHFWKGGLTKENRRLRNSVHTILWRQAVFKRDNYTCQTCFTRGGHLNADHIKPWSKYPELRFKLTNGRTLCIDCHKKTNTFGYKAFLNK